MFISEHNNEPSKTYERVITRGTVMKLPDMQLWQEFQAGSEAAYATIYKEHVQLLYGYGVKLLPDKELVMDAIQDLFVEMWDARQRLGEVRSIRAYLISSIRRKILAQASQHKRMAGNLPDEANLPDTEPSAEHALIERQIRDDELKKLKAAVSCLKPDQQEVIYLKYYARLSYDEMAAITASNKKAVYNLMARAIHTLRTSLEAIILAALCAFYY